MSLLYPKLTDLGYELEIIQNDIDTLRELKRIYNFVSVATIPIVSEKTEKYVELYVALFVKREKLHKSAILPTFVTYNNLTNNYTISIDKLLFLMEEIDLQASTKADYTGNGALFKFNSAVSFYSDSIVDLYLNQMLAQLRIFNIYLVPFILIRQVWVPTAKITYNEHKQIESLLHEKFTNFYADYKNRDKTIFRLEHVYFMPPNTIIVYNPDIKFTLFTDYKGRQISDFSARDLLLYDTIKEHWNFTEIVLQMKWPNLTTKETLLLQKIDIEFQFSFGYLVINADTNEGLGILLQILNKFVFKPVKFHTYTSLEETMKYLLQQYATGIYSGLYTDTYNVNTYQTAENPTSFIKRHIYAEFQLREFEILLDLAPVINYFYSRLGYDVGLDEVEDNKEQIQAGRTGAYLANQFFQLQFSAPYYLSLASFRLHNQNKLKLTGNFWTKYITAARIDSDKLNTRLKIATQMNKIVRELTNN